MAGKGTVGGHDPREGGQWAGVAETQCGGGAVHAGACLVVEPDAGEVDGHVDFVAGVGVEAVEPYFVELVVHAFGPNLVDEHVGLNLVVVAAVDHQFGLGVEVSHGAVGLAVGEIAYRRG